MHAIKIGFGVNLGDDIALLDRIVFINKKADDATRYHLGRHIHDVRFDESVVSDGMRPATDDPRNKEQQPNGNEYGGNDNSRQPMEPRRMSRNIPRRCGNWV